MTFKFQPSASATFRAIIEKMQETGEVVVDHPVVKVTEAADFRIHESRSPEGVADYRLLQKDQISGGFVAVAGLRQGETSFYDDVMGPTLLAKMAVLFDVEPEQMIAPIEVDASAPALQNV